MYACYTHVIYVTYTLHMFLLQYMSVCDVSPMKPQPLYIACIRESAREGGGGEMTRQGCQCVGEGGRGHSPAAQASAAAEGGGGPDGPRPMRPHPSAAHADQRRDGRDGRASGLDTHTHNYLHSSSQSPPPRPPPSTPPQRTKIYT